MDEFDVDDLIVGGGYPLKQPGLRKRPKAKPSSTLWRKPKPRIAR